MKTTGGERFSVSGVVGIGSESVQITIGGRVRKKVIEGPPLFAKQQPLVLLLFTFSPICIASVALHGRCRDFGERAAPT